MRERFPVFDLHCDTATELFARKQAWQKNSLQLDLERAGRLMSHIQVYAFCCVYSETGEPLSPDEAEQRFLMNLSNFYSELELHRDTHRLCRTAEDMIAAVGEGKHPVLLALEGPEAIGCDPGRLEELKELGFVMTTLTWNYKNTLAGSHLTGEGLSPEGKIFVRRAQELGLILDVSHLSEQAFWDLCDVTSAPFIASHSNSRAVCNHSRNLTDEQFKVIRNFGGLVGLNLYAPFLNESGKADFSDVRRHLEHFLSLRGENFVSLGGDLDGCDALPVGFRGVDNYNDLGRWLLGQGMEELQVLNFMNNNASRFFLTHLQKKRVGEFTRSAGDLV